MYIWTSGVFLNVAENNSYNMSYLKNFQEVFVQMTFRLMARRNINKILTLSFGR